MEMLFCMREGRTEAKRAGEEKVQGGGEVAAAADNNNVI